jgi:hypothetical protein
MPSTETPVTRYSDSTVYAELWVSLASLLRSYTAAHGLNRQHQATVELGQEQIVVRIGNRWLDLARNQSEVIWTREDGTSGLMRFTLEGTLQTHVGDEGKEDCEEEMDMQAEAWARELMR